MRILGVSLAILILVAVNSTSAVASEGKGMQQLPGTVPHALGLLQEMARARAARGPNYKPRTRHLRADGWAKYTNRLFLESSPYLLQHAHNPVNWYPWGDAAFQEAKRQNKPVLLSIGYSTCHWCHVMEKESFEDEEIAKFMNENYIAIKVDREERPDLDAIYMAAVQALTGRGGWPMTVWLTPDRRPFYGGTYFPARDGDRGAQIGFLTLLSTLREIYTTEPRKVAQAEAELANVIQRMLVPAGGNLVPVEHVLETAFEIYESRFDSVYGGLKTAPKFPSSLPIRILLRDHRRTGNPKALRMATLTLEKMASGGMYDHIGGGFHRYSTDAYWLVPHFEKMLYDNALLTLAYLEGYQVTGRSDFRRIVREILSYVERDMMAPEGGFYSATDADSLNLQGHLEEGWYFTWTPAELEAVLDKKDSQLVAEYYGVTAHGNFEGRNILNTPNPISEVAKKFAQGEQSTSVMIDLAKHRLYRARGQRPPPIRDEKILTAWNGLMISAYAQTGLALGEKHYLQRAQQAARFIAENLYQDGRLSRSYKDGKAHINGYLDDYAFFIRALLDLYEATGNLHWFELAIALDRTLENHYEDKISGGYFMTSDDHEKLLAREKPVYDGALPSGNSVAMTNLLRLYEFTSDDRYRKRAEKALRFSGDVVTRAPEGQSELLLALDFYYDTPKQIVIVTAKHREEAEPLLSTLGGSFVPNRIVVTVVQDEATENHGKYIPLVNQKVAIKGQPTAYVCEGGICQLPTTDPGVFTRQITAMKMGE